MPYQGVNPNASFTFPMVLIDSSNRPQWKINPTLAVGDVKIIKDGSDSTNIATLPVVSPAGDYQVRVTLASSEIGSTTLVRFHDATGGEWDDNGEVVMSTPVMANLIQIDGLTTAGTNATLNLKQLNISNSADYGVKVEGGTQLRQGVASGRPALKVEATAPNSPAIYATASDIAATVKLEGADINAPIVQVLGGPSRSAVEITGTGSNSGVLLSGARALDLVGTTNAIHATAPTAVWLDGTATALRASATTGGSTIYVTKTGGTGTEYAVYVDATTLSRAMRFSGGLICAQFTPGTGAELLLGSDSGGITVNSNNSSYPTIKLIGGSNQQGYIGTLAGNISGSITSITDMSSIAGAVDSTLTANHGAGSWAGSADTTTIPNMALLMTAPLQWDFASTPAKLNYMNDTTTEVRAYQYVFKEDGVSKPASSDEVATRGPAVFITPET